MIDTQYRLVGLTPTLSLVHCSSDGRDRQALYAAFTAASVLQGRIHGDVDKYLAAKPRARAIWDTAHLPAVSRLRKYLQAQQDLEFQITRRYHHQSDRWLYVAKSRDSQIILVKFVRQYSASLHAFCSDSGHAPQILAYEDLPGGWKAVAMEYIETGVPITVAPELTTYRDKWTEELKKLVKSFHENGFVHGDLRDPNIICDDKGGVFLVDFDWSGKEGEVFYPTPNLNEELLEGRATIGLKITRADGDRVLQKTLNKLNKVAIR
jgi:serine/threonine protein kinase